MAGYSGTPLARKLGIKGGSRLLLIGAPAGFADTLEGMPEGVEVATRAGKKPAQVIVLFCPDAKAYLAKYEGAKGALDQSGGLWIAWPKKSSGIKTDLTEDVIRRHALVNGLVDNKVCAIDDTWSGLRLVVRVKDRV